jgi:hypothetical protein
MKPRLFGLIALILIAFAAATSAFTISADKPKGASKNESGTETVFNWGSGS